MSHTGGLYRLCIVAVLLTMTVVVGRLFRKNEKNSAQFLHANRSLPTFITALAFLAANCGALEVVGIVAGSAKYGAFALHFYWIGSIPAMVFLALFVVPVYLQSRALTVPEFLRLRYNRETHILNMVATSIMMACIAGISLYAIATVLGIFLGWGFFPTVTLGSLIVFCYVWLGGLKATIYNEVLQFAVTVAGLIPLAYMVMRQFHGLRGIATRLPSQMTHVWQGMPLASPASTMDVFGVVFGLGFVLAFGYWTTDFVIIQRALAAKTRQGSINTPLIAAAAKLFFPIMVVVPGLAAGIFLRQRLLHNTDQALPWLMLHYYGPAMLGLGIAAIIASLMSSLAGNINAQVAILTHDLYKTYVCPNGKEAHYVRVGRLATLLASVVSIGTAYIAFRYNSLIDYLQLILSLFNAPLFATFLLGMFTTWVTPTAAFWGLVLGMAASISHVIAFRGHLIHYGSDMLANFYGAAYGWSFCMAATMVISRFTEPKSLAQLDGITYRTMSLNSLPIPRGSWLFAALLVGVCVALNVIFR